MGNGGVRRSFATGPAERRCQIAQARTDCGTQALSWRARDQQSGRWGGLQTGLESRWTLPICGFVRPWRNGRRGGLVRASGQGPHQPRRAVAQYRFKSCRPHHLCSRLSDSSFQWQRPPSVARIPSPSHLDADADAIGVRRPALPDTPSPFWRLQGVEPNQRSLRPAHPTEPRRYEIACVRRTSHLLHT